MPSPTGQSTLQPDPKNANAGTQRGLGMVERSLQQYGAGRSILASADGIILAGNKTYDRAVELGIPVQEIESDGHTLFVIKRTDLPYDDPRARELAIADNRASETGLEWDTEVLTALADEGVDLEQFWFEDELADLLGIEGTTEGLTDPDAVPEPPAEPITKPGDIWCLGEHRLMCGDSTVVTDVERLMAGRKATCLWTDPPYGVSYVGKTKRALTIQNDGSDGLADLLHDAFTNATMFCIEGAAYYVARPAGALSVTFGNAILGAGWRLHQELQWVKDSMVLGHSDYHIKHETIVFGYMPGGGRRGRGGEGWYGDNAQVSVFEVDRPKASPDHPTGKPVDLITQHLVNSTQASDIVLDLFGGSGSTLIACEQTGRTCYLNEIDPAYCDVIVTRWQDYTGQTATREPAAEAAD